MKSKSITILLMALAAANVAVFFFNPEKALSIILISKDYILEMLSILPPILILIGLFEVWVPKSFIEKAMGKASGLKGILFFFLVGTAAMGPLYVAFPLSLSLLRKGASLFNVSIFLCVWASIKIPMILFEIKFLGANFAGLRLALTIPSIIAISWLFSLILKGDIRYETA